MIVIWVTVLPAQDCEYCDKHKAPSQGTDIESGKNNVKHSTSGTREKEEEFILHYNKFICLWSFKF